MRISERNQLRMQGKLPPFPPKPEGFVPPSQKAAPQAEDVERYRAAVMQCHMMGQVLQQYDLPELIRAINMAESIGPIVDPTLWRDKRKAMSEDKEVLQACLPIWELVKKNAGGGK